MIPSFFVFIAPGTALITVPRNDNGQSYVCYSRAGIGGAFAVTTQSVRQDFEGAPDLDIPPAENGIRRESRHVRIPRAARFTHLAVPVVYQLTVRARIAPARPVRYARAAHSRARTA